MKVINVIHAFCALLMSSCIAVAIQPSTFGGVVDGFGRLTNTIKVNIQHVVQHRFRLINLRKTLHSMNFTRRLKLSPHMK